MSALATMLAAARGEIGVVERPVNRVRYNTAFYGREVSGNAYPWCQAWVWWLGVRTALAAILPPKTAGTQAAAAWYRARGRWGTEPAPGAQAFYDWGHGIAHTGIVEAGRTAAGWFPVIEGNTGPPGRSQDNGGMVLRQARRGVGRTGGFGYPDYAAADRHGVSLPVLATGAVVPLAAGLARRPDVLPVLARGASGGWVSLAQQCLGTGVDGAFGPGTEREVRDQQHDYGLGIDGVIGAWTWVSFIADVAGNLRPGQGEGHPGVEVLQNLLGYRGPALDRRYGPGSAARTAQVQRWAGLTPDEIVGPATRAALTRG